MDLPLDAIDEAPDNPRLKIGDIRDLAESIREVGIIQPLTVTPTTEGRYMVVAGHRRLAAAHRAGLDRVPVVVRKMTGDERVAAMVVENVHRRQLTTREKGLAYRRLIDEYGLTQAEVARRVGVHPTTVHYALSLLENPEARAERLRDVRERRMAGETVIGRPTAAKTPQEIIARLRDGAEGHVGAISLSYEQCRIVLRMLAEGARAVAAERERVRRTGEMPPTVRDFDPADLLANVGNP